MAVSPSSVILIAIQVISARLGDAKLSTSQLYTRVSVGRMMQSYKRFDISRSQLFSIWRRTLYDEFDYAGALPVPQPKTSEVLHYSPHQNKRSCYRSRQLLDLHGAVHRAIKGVL